MSNLYGHAIGVMILLMMTVFIGIWVWAWLPRHKVAFGDLSKIPMEDGNNAATSKCGEMK